MVLCSQIKLLLLYQQNIQKQFVGGWYQQQNIDVSLVQLNFQFVLIQFFTFLCIQFVSTQNIPIYEILRCYFCFIQVMKCLAKKPVTKVYIYAKYSNNNIVTVYS